MNAADRARVWLHRAPLAMPADPKEQTQIYRRLLAEAEDHIRQMLVGEPPWAAPAPAARDYETEAALCEGAENDASDAYFRPRQQLDSRAARRLFAAGFARGWSTRGEDKP